MCTCGRRQFLKGVGAGLVACAPGTGAWAALDEKLRLLVAEAQRMRREALARGDQPYGAVLAKDGAIIGYGPSRVVVDKNPDAHAERVAIWDAQKRLGAADLSGTTLVSTSRPCGACEDAAARANVGRMLFGATASDAGRPQRG